MMDDISEEELKRLVDELHLKINDAMGRFFVDVGLWDIAYGVSDVDAGIPRITFDVDMDELLKAVCGDDQPSNVVVEALLKDWSRRAQEMSWRGGFKGPSVEVPIEALHHLLHNIGNGDTGNEIAKATVRLWLDEEKD